MNTNNLDSLVERAMQKHSMPLAEFIRTEHLQNYELGYEDILYADEINIAKIPYDECMILLRERSDHTDEPVVEYAIYYQEDRDGHPLKNSLNMNAIYHLWKVSDRSFGNMVDAIRAAADEIM